MNEELKSKFEALIENSFFNINGPNTTEEIMLILKAAYDMAKADEWVSVETALPEKDGRYLAYVKPGSGLYDWGAHSLIYDSQNGFGRATHKHVTHWQPLPKAPKL